MLYGLQGHTWITHVYIWMNDAPLNPPFPHFFIPMKSTVRSLKPRQIRVRAAVIKSSIADCVGSFFMTLQTANMMSGFTGILLQQSNKRHK